MIGQCLRLILVGGTVGLFLAGGCHHSPVASLAVQRFFLDEGMAAVSPPRSWAVGTYNVHGMWDVRWLYEDLQVLESVNAWAMQEVETTEDGVPWDRTSPNETLLRRFRDILPPGTWHGVYVPVNQTGNTWEGQAIVSRWPIQKAEVWDLERTGGKRRVALAAWLATPNGALLFINTDHETSLVLTGPQDRARQVHSLLQRLVNHRDLPCILVGDFNTSGWMGMDAASEIAALRSSLRDIGFAPHSETFDETTFHSWPLSLSLDHMFGRRVTCSEWAVHPTKGSDHCVLWGRFEKMASQHSMPRRSLQSVVRER